MKFTQILLVMVFLAVAALYTVRDVADRFSTADEGPVLTCSDEILEISVADDDSVLLSGISAADAQDGDITHRVLVTGTSRLIDSNTAKVTYAVFDSDHNMATLTRRIRYTDYRLPRFSLDEPLIYPAYSQFRLLDRLSARDVVDGDITGSIRMTYRDNSTNPGIHSIDVQVTNSLGDTAWLTLPIIFLESMDNQVEIDLDTCLVYLNRGDSFQPRSYLKGVSLGGAAVSTDSVTISGDVDTGTPGVYQVTYSCVSGGCSGTVILTVVVE